jgi:hypothetical protein
MRSVADSAAQEISSPHFEMVSVTKSDLPVPRTQAGDLFFVMFRIPPTSHRFEQSVDSVNAATRLASFDKYVAILGS